MDPHFPCALTISIPLPTHRLASSALRALRVDAELSPLVRRTFSLLTPDPKNIEFRDDAHERSGVTLPKVTSSFATGTIDVANVESQTVLRTEYKATTNRMLRVAVNGFMESLGVVLSVMEELDIDVLAQGDL